MSRIKSELISNLEITDINCCNTPYIIQERGQSICINCGIVQEEKVIDNNPVQIYDSYDVVKKKHSDLSKAFGSSTMFKVGTDYQGNSLHRFFKH